MTLKIHGKYRRLIEGNNIKLKNYNKKSSYTKKPLKLKA